MTNWIPSITSNVWVVSSSVKLNNKEYFYEQKMILWSGYFCSLKNTWLWHLIYPEATFNSSKSFCVLGFQYLESRLASRWDMCIQAKFHFSGSTKKYQIYSWYKISHSKRDKTTGLMIKSYCAIYLFLWASIALRQKQSRMLPLRRHSWIWKRLPVTIYVLNLLRDRLTTILILNKFSF